MVSVSYTSRDLMRAMGVKRLGTYACSIGWTLGGRRIAKVEFARGAVVRFSDPEGVCFAVFQDSIYLDD